ncbi:MAG: glycosyltransferase family 2 protein [Nitrospirae bacterium]|nr:glycosyltransferase family 2 protein [Nitrospirota bacterium]
MQGPLLSVIIIQWNQSGLLRDCLDSLFREAEGIDIETIVFDNGSTDGSPDMVERDYPSVRLIRNGENIGFAKGNNRAARHARGKYLLLLNSDTVMQPRTVRGMAGFLEGKPKAAGCAPALRLPDGRLQMGAFGYALSIPTLFNYFFLLSSLFPRMFRAVWQDQASFVRSGVPVEADWLCGACLMVRRDAFEAAGGFDEGYHLYSEDMDLGDRLRASGGLYFIPSVEVIHLGGGSGTPGQLGWLTSLFRYISSRHGAAYLAACRAIAAAGFLARGVAYKAAGLFRPGYDENALRMFGYLGHCLGPVPSSGGEGVDAAGAGKP